MFAGPAGQRDFISILTNFRYSARHIAVWHGDLPNEPCVLHQDVYQYNRPSIKPSIRYAFFFPEWLFFRWAALSAGFWPQRTNVRLGPKPLCGLAHRKNLAFRKEKSADARELLPGQHIHNPTAADAGFHDDLAAMIIDHLADDSCILAKGILPYGGQYRVGVRC